MTPSRRTQARRDEFHAHASHFSIESTTFIENVVSQARASPKGCSAEASRNFDHQHQNRSPEKLGRTASAVSSRVLPQHSHLHRTPQPHRNSIPSVKTTAASTALASLKDFNLRIVPHVPIGVRGSASFATFDTKQHFQSQSPRSLQIALAHPAKPHRQSYAWARSIIKCIRHVPPTASKSRRRPQIRHLSRILASCSTKKPRPTPRSSATCSATLRRSIPWVMVIPDFRP